MIKKIAHLQCITWDGATRNHVEQTRLLLAAGAEWIQLRQKAGSTTQQLDVARQCVTLCQASGATLIINDNVTLCKESGAQGVHLGLMDMPIAQARAILGPDAIIGGTANTPDQVLQRWHEGADYVGLGPWRYTGTKKNLSSILGAQGVTQAIQALLNAGAFLPVLVIGGIVPTDVTTVLDLGAHGVAVSSAVVSAPSVQDAYLEFKKSLTLKGI